MIAIAPIRATGTGLRPCRMAGMTNPMMTANETARAISDRTPCQRPTVDHCKSEQRHQHQDRSGPLEVTDVVEGGLAFLLEHRHPDLLAGPEACSGRVGGVEADNLAVYQLRLDLDAGGAGQARAASLHGTCWTWVRVALTSRVGSS